MIKKSAFFDFLNRRDETDFDRFITDSIEDEHYINWNEFALPHDYGDAEAEYFAIRNSCAIFDVSPIRKIRVRGQGAGAFFERVLTRPVSKLPAMRATYTVFCNDNGSLKDDAILYKFDDDDYLLMPSDIDHRPYFESVCQRFELNEVSFTECTDAWAGLAIQGPLSAKVLQVMGLAEVEQLRPFEVRRYDLNGSKLYVSRMGFTADLGYECWFDPSLAEHVMQSIQSARLTMEIPIPGYGLSALQVCRLEGGFIVAGWDCATEVEPNPGFERSPFELGLGWLVNLEAKDFVGRDALLLQRENGPQFTLRSFQLDQKSAPDDGAEIYLDANSNTCVGVVNCSTWSWGMNRLIGNASIKTEYAELDTALVTLDGKSVSISLSRGPLVTLERRNRVPAPLCI